MDRAGLRISTGSRLPVRLGTGPARLTWTLFGHFPRPAVCATRAKYAMRKGGLEPREKCGRKGRIYQRKPPRTALNPRKLCPRGHNFKTAEEVEEAVRIASTGRSHLQRNSFSRKRTKIMKKQNESALRRVAREIRQEARRQVGGFPQDELRRQLLGGWGTEFARQIFGAPKRRRASR